MSAADRTFEILANDVSVTPGVAYNLDELFTAVGGTAPDGGTEPNGDPSPVVEAVALIPVGSGYKISGASNQGGYYEVALYGSDPGIGWFPDASSSATVTFTSKSASIDFEVDYLYWSYDSLYTNGLWFQDYLDVGFESAAPSLTLSPQNTNASLQLTENQQGIITSSNEAGKISFDDNDLTSVPIGSIGNQIITATDSHGHSVVLTTAQIQILKAEFSISVDPGNSNDGTLNWTYSGNALDFLAAGSYRSNLAPFRLEMGIARAEDNAGPEAVESLIAGERLMAGVVDEDQKIVSVRFDFLVCGELHWLWIIRSAQRRASGL